MSGEVPRPPPKALLQAIEYMEASARRLDRKFDRDGTFLDAAAAMRLSQAAQWLRANGFRCESMLFEQTSSASTFWHCTLAKGHDGTHECGERNWK